MFKIEKGVPPPDTAKHLTKYPLGEMEVNDSFVAPKNLAGTIRSAAAYYRRKYHKQFIVRPDAKEPDSVRIWRIA